MVVQILIRLQQHLTECRYEVLEVLFTKNLDNEAGMRKILWLQQTRIFFICLKIFANLAYQLVDDQILLLVELLNLGDVLVFLKVVGEFIEGGYEVGNLLVASFLTAVSQFLEGIHHHNELFQGIDAESQVFLGDVEAFQVFAHLVYDFFTLRRLLSYDTDLPYHLFR